MSETFSPFNVFDHLRTVEDCHAYIVESHHAMDEQRAEITRLRERLEVDLSHPYDGIDCRDETIRLLEREIDRLRKRTL